MRAIFKTSLSFALSATAVCEGTEGVEFFETHIRPLLIQHCYECHSADAKKLKANLSLDTRQGWETGGDSGPAIVPGKPEESLLIKAVSHLNGDLEMPPKTKLPDQDIARLKEWIAMGAGELAVVPENTWHRFVDSVELKVLAVTPDPSDHQLELPA